MQVAEFTVV